jgi:Domain of unknown function (DUF6456)
MTCRPLPKAPSPSETQRLLAREGYRLLAALAESGAIAERDESKLRVMVKRSGVSMQACLVPVSALAPLLSAGSVRCRSRGGEPSFEITPEGRQALKRLASGEEGFQRQHQEVERQHLTKDGVEGAVLVNTREDPLDWLRRRQGKNEQVAISPAGFAAGERLRRDLHLAQTLPRVTSNWSSLAVDASRISESMLLSERSIAAKLRVERAFRAIDPSFSGILIDICGFAKGLDLVERERGWPARSAKLVLKFALDALAAHYGLSNAASGRENSASRSWNDGDRAKIIASRAV